MPTTFPVRCRCGRSYGALAWYRLPGAPWRFSVDDLWMLRHCECGSSLTVALVPEAAWRAP